MNQTVEIRILGRQRRGGKGAPETEEVETRAAGHYWPRGLVRYVQYEEVPEGAGAAVATLLKIEPGRMTMTKKGPLNARMEFVPGERTYGEYQTPYGRIPLTVSTEDVTVDDKAGQFRLSVRYRLESDGLDLSENELEVNVSGMRSII